jgi:quinol monooxygenase YgiN
MPYVRISIAKPTGGQSDAVKSLMKRINDFVSAQDGCQVAYLLSPSDKSGELARMAIYDDEDSAEKTANSQTVLSLRSEMHQIIEAGHIERAFHTED